MFKQTPRGLPALLVWLALPALAAAADFYASPNGNSGASGSINSPWTLAAALAGPAAVHPGDTIWLRGGTYTFPQGGNSLCGLRGTAAAPITVAQYPGERATLDVKGAAQGLFFTNSPNPAGAAYVNFKNFEVTNSDTNRVPGMPVGLYVRLSNHLKFINLIVHDTGEAFYLPPEATNTEVYGCVVYYNGDENGQEHGIYIRNVSGYKKAIDNIVFSNSGYGIHAYPHAGDPALLNVSLVGNTAFNNGLLGSAEPSPDLLLGGQAPAVSSLIDGNATYKAVPGTSWNSQLGYAAGCTGPTMTNNYFVGTTVWTACTSGLTLTGNSFYGSTLRQPNYSGPTTPLDVTAFPDNTYTTARPTGTRVFVRPNLYEVGRANITVYNWDLRNTVPVDLNGAVSVGSYYEIRNAQNPFGPPVVTGTYYGNPIALPMTGLTPATPVGVSAPAPTGPEFNVFLVTSTLGPYEFYDVPQSDAFHGAIHTLASNGITAGCGNGNYCPNSAISRAQMAVFLLKSKHGAQYVPPPATGNVFADVPAGAFAAAWIENLAAEGITSGCGGGNYCPNASVTRAQMAVLLLKTSLGPGYAPPPATGMVFTDVPASAFAASWIEDLAARGITAGCGGGRYCPGSISTRAQMAVFLTAAFGLQ